MDNDDRQIGRLLTRRELVAFFGASAAALAMHRVTAAQATASVAGAPNCIAIPQQTEGPYFVDEKLLRSDIRQDPSNGRISGGTPLELRLNITSLGAANVCTPLAGAMVDVWQCDAMGIYSDVEDPSFNTKGQKYLRGYQTSDASGIVRFTTIYPGWYPGRAVHIHFKIRTPQRGVQPATEFVSQFYFDEAMTDRIHARQPYAAHTGQRLRNERDMFFREGGAQLMLPVTESGQNLAGTFSIAVAPGTQPPPNPFGPGGRGRGRGGRQG